MRHSPMMSQYSLLGSKNLLEVHSFSGYFNAMFGTKLVHNGYMLNKWEVYLRRR